MALEKKQQAEMANFVTNMPGWTPDMYWRITIEEREAIVNELNRQSEELKKARKGK